MQITVTWQGIVLAASVVGAVIALVAYFAKAVRWVDKQNEQDKKIDALEKHHDADMARTNKELALIVHGVLACLKGLSEQGCNGPVTAAINEIEEYLNEKAHE